MRAARLIFSVTFVVGLAGLGQLSCKKHQDPVSNATAAVGEPCTPSPESAMRFGGFRVTEDTLESGAPECNGGFCIAYHFQGRTSCPLGQPEPVDAQGNPGCVPEKDAGGDDGQGTCAPGFTCMSAGSLSPKCDPADEGADAFCASFGAGSSCNDAGFCECSVDADCLALGDVVTTCDPQTKQCLTYACHKPGDCQDPDEPPSVNAGKACCQPGTDLPVITAVCGQCQGIAGESTRDADSSVYCTCRCGVADGAPEEPDYPFCTCGDGFECTEVRQNLDLGDPEHTGKFCLKAGTQFDPEEDQCGLVDGHWTAGGGLSCSGVGSGKCTGDAPCSD